MRLLTLALIAAILGVAGAYFATFYGDNSVLKSYALEPLSCNLLKRSCAVVSDSGDAPEIIVDITPKPINIMRKSRITLTLPDGVTIDEPKLRIHGLNMDMGTIIVSLKRDGQKLYGDVALSACILGSQMRYRIDLYSALTPLKLHADFDLDI